MVASGKRRWKKLARRWRNVVFGSAGLALATASWGFEDAAAPAGGPTLNGILPAEVPDGLTSDDFGALPESWKEWGSTAATAVEQLFRTHDSLDSLNADLATVDVKLGTLRKALADSRYRSISGPLADLYGRLNRRVAVAKAILAAQQLDPTTDYQTRVDDAFGQLRSAVETIDQTLSRYPNGSHWGPFLRLPELKAMVESKQADRDVLATVKEHLAGRSTLADEKQRNFLSRDMFIQLERAIDDALNVPMQMAQGDYVAALQKIGGELFAAIEQYEQRGDELSAKAIRDQYAQWRMTAADGGDGLSKVLRAHYLNYNLRALASEGFLKKLFRTSKQEGSWINERVMEATVAGTQCVDTNVDVDLKPSDGTGSFSLMLTGTVRTNTNGYTSQATVHTVGNHSFWAQKQIFFDGHNFFANPAAVNVAVNNRTIDAQTNIRIPIIKGIANRIAMGEVEKRKPQVDALTRQKIVQNLGPRMDREVGSQFDKATTKLEARVYGPLRELDSYPQDLAVSSSDTALMIRGRLMEDVELGGDEPMNVAIPSDGLVIQVHESLLNNSMERAGFNGREMTQDQLQAELRARIEKLIGRKLDEQTKEVAPKVDPTPTDAGDAADEKVDESAADNNAIFVFDSHDAIRFDVTDGVVRIIMRAGLKREGSDPIPTQLIEVPLGFTVANNEIKVERKGSVAVRPTERVANRAEQIVRANVMRANIQKLLPERILKGTLDLKMDNKTVTVKVTEVTPRDGWVTIIAR
jgi:hypothetical protein